ncbi:MAG: response regulator [Saprospiraceae bacterium]|nr:response regulator [Saprospiraceae bacterium]
MITAIIIDDENKGRIALRQKLTDYCPDIQIVGEAENGEQGIILIQQCKPNIVFLDIEMPRMNGFDMLNHLAEKNFHLIFTTAYDHYAIKAIKFAAFDYLLKPIDIEELKNAVSKLTKIKPLDITPQLDVLIQNAYRNSKGYQKIAIPTMEGISFFETDDLIHLDAESNYTMLYFTQNRKILASKTLKEFEEQLPTDRFFRIHHSHIVNLKFIVKYIKGEGGQLIMENGKSLDVSRRKKGDLIQKLI